ncbi:MAG TPA: hypothetical protein PKA27_09940, partial [Fimbriimonadaceae bacterium]|nr:hypothetical protein [Fimbriimonadaceae bacterium]
MKQDIKIRRTQRGNAMLAVFGILTLLGVGSATFISRATESLRTSHRQMRDVQSTHLCEAGVQAVLRSLWRPFKINQNFNDMGTRCALASADSPGAATSGTIPGVGAYSAGVTRYTEPDS